MTGSLQAQAVLLEALGTLESELGDDSPELIATLFALGSATSSWEAPDRRQMGYFDRAVEIASNESSFGPEAVADLEIQIALKLVRLSEGSPSGDYRPLVKVAPAYPTEAARLGLEGYFVLQYTVDERGRTRDIVVLESGLEPLSNRARSNTFDEAAIRSAEQYRYLPRFENGVPVSVPGVTTRISFELED